MGDPFKLKSSGSSSSFGARHKDVFNFEEVSLKRPNKKEKTDEDPDRRAVDAKDFKGRRSLYHEEDEDRAVRRNVATADKFAAFRDRRRGADGGAVFKRPARPPPAGSRRRERDPSKYTKYSLADVDVLNNSSNAQAAFSFLRELDERKKRDGEDKELDQEKGDKIAFKRPSKKKSGETADETPPPKRAGKEMKLSHLMDEEEDDG